MTEPRKTTSFKLNAEELQKLEYLAMVSHSTNGEVIRTLVQVMASTVRSMAIQRDPELARDTDLVLNGGKRLLISRDEQQAWTWLVTGLETIRDHGRTWWAGPL
ncbi:MAG: hypothetical protein ACYCZM_14645 [Acidimicrobiales bacterium]